MRLQNAVLNFSIDPSRDLLCFLLACIETPKRSDLTVDGALREVSIQIALSKCNKKGTKLELQSVDCSCHENEVAQFQIGVKPY